MYIITEDGFALNLVGADCLYFKPKHEIVYDGDMCRKDKNGKCVEKNYVEIFAYKGGKDWLIKRVKSAIEAKKYILDLLKFKGDAVLSNDLSHFE